MPTFIVKMPERPYTEPAPDPKDYEDRLAWKRAAIDRVQRHHAIDRELGEQLRDRGWNVLGNGGPTLVVADVDNLDQLKADVAALLAGRTAGL